MRGPSRRGSSPRISSTPSVGGDTQPIMRMVELLPAPLGPEEAERLAPAHVDVDAVDRDEVAEPLDQATRVNE